MRSWERWEIIEIMKDFVNLKWRASVLRKQYIYFSYLVLHKMKQLQDK